MNPEQERETILKSDSLISRWRPRVDQALELLKPYMVEATLDQKATDRQGHAAQRMNLLLALAGDCYRIRKDSERALYWYQQAGQYWNGGVHITHFAILVLEQERNDLYETVHDGPIANRAASSELSLLRKISAYLFFLPGVLFRPWEWWSYLTNSKQTKRMMEELERRIASAEH